MADEFVLANLIPCGGAAMLDLSSSDKGPWTLSRSLIVSGVATQTATLIASGAAPPGGKMTYFDVGNGTAAPLLQHGTYQYTLTTATGQGSAQVQPGNEIALVYDDYTTMLMKLLKSGLSVLVPPDGIDMPEKPSVYHAMPITASPRLPLVSVSETLMEQWLTKIGPATNESIFRNSYVAAAQVRRRYQVTVMATTPAARDFLKFAVLGIFQTIVAPVLGRLGQNVEHSFMAASNQKAEKDLGPGFYYCDISLDFAGVFSTQVNTGYPIVEAFTIVSDTDGIQETF